MSHARVNLYPLYIYADPNDGTGHLFVEQGVKFEAHIRIELERLIPRATRFLDIGANVGFHTITARCIRPGIPIIAIEAHPKTADLLVKACVEQHQHGITVITTCLNDHNGHIMADRRNSNATHAPVGAWNGDEFTYSACTMLDLYDTSGVDLVKMDIDGFEYRALLGASRLLHAQPKIIFEYHLGVIQRSGIGGIELLQLLRSHGYQFTALQPERIPFGTDIGALHHHATMQPEKVTDVLAEPTE